MSARWSIPPIANNYRHCNKTLQSVASNRTPMDKKKERMLGCRVALFPQPFVGHMTPVVHLPNFLHSKGFSITIIHTISNLQILPNSTTSPFIPLIMPCGKLKILHQMFSRSYMISMPAAWLLLQLGCPTSWMLPRLKNPFCLLDIGPMSVFGSSSSGNWRIWCPQNCSKNRWHFGFYYVCCVATSTRKGLLPSPRYFWLSPFEGIGTVRWPTNFFLWFSWRLRKFAPVLCSLFFGGEGRLEN